MTDNEKAEMQAEVFVKVHSNDNVSEDIKSIELWLGQNTMDSVLNLEANAGKLKQIKNIGY